MNKYINKICYGDSIELLKKLSDSSIDICITSPPYKEKDGYSLVIAANDSDFK